MSTYQHARGWLDSDIWGNEPYSERESWSWMVGEAAWKDCTVPINGRPVITKRGQFTASLRFMACKWQWNKNKVDRYLNKLKLWQMIEIETDIGTGQTVVTICNYNKYQVKGAKNGTANGTDAGQLRDKQEKILKVQTKPKEYYFNGKIIRLTERDFLSMNEKAGMTHDGFGEWLSKRDEYYARLPEAERADWWQRINNSIKSMRFV